MKIFDYYDLILENNKRNQNKKNILEKGNININAISVYEFKDDVRIISTSGLITNTYLSVHNLSHYKNKKTNIELGIRLKSCIEELVFDSVSISDYYSTLTIKGDT